LRAFRRTLAERNQTKSILLWLHCSGSLHACSHAPWHLHGRLQCPQPRPKPGEAEGRRGVHPGPPPSDLLPCSMPTALPSPEQTHSTPRPSQNPPSTRAWPPCLVSLNARAQDPHSDELLDAFILDAPPYKYPRRSNRDTHLTPRYLPDTLV
jgi:hypothetical protein